ncbi:hypothetical protein HMI56_004952 [Coelomomyces lativittatus]|nr:hypothetical protein HMI56_004952 [Coelomomyces lativittatus]
MPTSSHFSSPSPPPTCGRSVRTGSTVLPLPVIWLPCQSSPFHHPLTYTSAPNPVE